MIKESELDDDQIKVLMETLDKSCIVAGCAGSGKSVLALIKAKRIQKEYGNNYKIIVFTKALCNYMSSGKQELELTNDFYYYKEWKYQRERKGQYMVYSRDKNGNMIPYMPSADYIIVDEFAREARYYEYLRDVENVQRNITFITKAEDKNLAVAAGSIISRYIFLKEFDKLCDSIHIPLPKGAGKDVDTIGEEVVEKYGKDKLKEIAKYNFKNTDRILHTLVM